MKKGESFITNDKWVDKINDELTHVNYRCTYGFGKKLQLRLDYIICYEKMGENIEYSMNIQIPMISDHLPIIAKFIM